MALSLALAMGLSLVACGGSKTEETEAPTEAETEATTLSSLLDPLERIKESIVEKNNLFLAEGEIVKNGKGKKIIVTQKKE